MADPQLTAMDVRELYLRFGRAVYRRCQYFLRNDADAKDAMHDVFLKVVERQREYRAEASPLTWIVRITTNHCLNILRARGAKWHQRYEQAVRVGQAAGEPAAPECERHQLVALVMARADRAAAEAALYYFVDEMTQEDAATAAGCSVPTLRKRLREFVRVARKHLKQVDAELVFGEVPV